MDYQFTLATETMLDQIYSLIEKRIKWMDEKGIKQWNVTDYTRIYPKTYYQKQIEENHVYVLVDSATTVVGAIVLLEEDERWEDSPCCKAYYLHNFVTDSQVKGVGKQILRAVEDLAIKKKKQKLRLDCAEGSAFLNQYYEGEGYQLVGTCIEGLYKGNKREKKLK